MSHLLLENTLGPVGGAAVPPKLLKGAGGGKGHERGASISQDKREAVMTDRTGQPASLCGDPIISKESLLLFLLLLLLLLPPLPSCMPLVSGDDDVLTQAA